MVCRDCSSERISKYTRANGQHDYYCHECGSKRKPLEDNGNVLIIGDLHLPFVLDGYLEFIKDLREKYNVADKNIYSAGDIIDNHAISFHEHDPNGMSAGEELRYVKNQIQVWGKEFPMMKIARGNHDALGSRQARASGLPREYIKSLEDVFEMPIGWEFRGLWQINDETDLIHGTGYSGLYPHANAARNRMKNTIIGHTHTVAGVHWIVNERTKIFGMAVGTGIDRTRYAFEYQRTFARKPVVSAGLLLGGKTPLIELMDL